MPKAKIFYHDIGDYLKQEEKLDIIHKFGSILNPQMKWKTLQPNDEGDWLNQRNEAFSEFVPLGDKKSDENSFFNPFYSRGLATARDSYCYNSSVEKLSSVINEFVNFYEDQRIGFHKKQKEINGLQVDDFVDFDSTKVTWNRGLKNDLSRNNPIRFESQNVVKSIYRPFFKQSLYFAKELNDMVYQLPKLFPNPSLKNVVICVSGVGVTKDFSTIITDTLPDLELIGKSQCFPLYYYEEQEQQDLFSQASGEKYIRRDGVSDFILQKAQKQYGKTVTKEDIFYYVYGFLHSPNYRESFANDLKKMLPRLPLVDDVRDFYKFSNAGRKLADLHINYEAVEPYEAEGFEVRGAGTSENSVSDDLYRVQKMRFPKKGQQDTIIYNSKITIAGIPEKAYEYVVNGKSAIDWIMERYQVKTDKNSGIQNDPNDWSTETGNPSYILDLLLSIINVSVQTVDIVKGLPEVAFE